MSINPRNNKLNRLNDQFEEIINNIFFDRVNILNSSFKVFTDSIQNTITIDKLTAYDINKDDGLFVKLNNFSGKVNEIKIDEFNSEISYNNGFIKFLNSNLISGDQYIIGNINFELDSQNLLNNFQESYVKFNLNTDNFKFLDKNLDYKINIEGEIRFEGLKEDIILEEFNLKTQFVEFKSNGHIKDLLSNNYEVSVDFSDINIFQEQVIKNLNLDQQFILPILNGNINFNNKLVSYNLFQKNNYESSVNINGIGLLGDQTSFDFNIILDLLKGDELIDQFNIDNLKLDSKFTIIPDQRTIFNGDLEIIKDDNNTKVDFNTKVVNNNLSSKLGINSKNLRFDIDVNGNLLDGNLEASSIIFLDNIPTKNINNISAEPNINIDFSNKNNIKFNLKFEEINLKTSSEKIYLSNLNYINDFLDYDFIDSTKKYDFRIEWIDNRVNLESNLGSNILINGYYKNENDLDLNFNLSNLFIKNFFEINKNPISGNIESKINLNRSDTNRTISLVSSINDIRINEYEIGDLEINTFGNTDFDSYSVNLKLSDKDKTPIYSEGTIIAINENSNIDLDIIIDDFDISFINKIGNNSINDLSSQISGRVNLWGDLNKLQHDGSLNLSNSNFSIPYTNITYEIAENSKIILYNQDFEFNDIIINHNESKTTSKLNGKISHINYKDWNLNLSFDSDRFFVLNKLYNEKEVFFGKGFLGGKININGPTNQIGINVQGKTEVGTELSIPRSQEFSIENFSFIDFIDINNIKESRVGEENLNSTIIPKTLDLIIDLEINDNALVDITLDPQTGSYLSGRGIGNLIMEIDSESEFNIYGDYITSEGIYNFKDLALVDKKFNLQKGGTIVWDGDPLEAQMNIQAIYSVPGGANPALLLDNPNFNKKIPTDVQINLTGNITKPDSPNFQIYFPNTSTTATTEINYKLSDIEVRQLQAISLLTQGIFINEVGVSIEGLTNNIYEKVSDVFTSLLGGSEGPLKVGLNYLQGDKSDILDIKTEDRFGVTLSTKISDNILFNGKIGVPIGGIEETLIIGDVQLDFILNSDGSLKAKVFNRENEFRYIGEELGYTQGIGLSYQVDFQTFRDLISKILQKNN